MQSASLPPSDAKVSFGEPPFIVGDGSDYFCILQADGSTLPIPYGYELSEEDVSIDDDTVLFSWPAAQSGSGTDIARLIPVAADFSAPDTDAFVIEELQEAESWDKADQLVNAIQESLLSFTMTIFAKTVYVGSLRLKEQFDEVKSLDEAVTILLSQDNIAAALFAAALETAISKLREEIEDDDSENES